jgi:beta-xylosidase
MGLVKDNGSPKLSASVFPKVGRDSQLGICQWFHYEDPRFDVALKWLRELGVRYLRTGVSWADSFRENAEAWFDHQMASLEDFDVTMTLCFTPEHLGIVPHYTSPPKNPQDFAEFCRWAVGRYAAGRAKRETRAVEVGVGE